MSVAVFNLRLPNNDFIGTRLQNRKSLKYGRNFASPMISGTRLLLGPRLDAPGVLLMNDERLLLVLRPKHLHQRINASLQMLRLPRPRCPILPSRLLRFYSHQSDLEAPQDRAKQKLSNPSHLRTLLPQPGAELTL